MNQRQSRISKQFQSNSQGYLNNSDDPQETIFPEMRNKRLSLLEIEQGGYAPKEQSLLKMFNAELFTTELHIEYLSKLIEDQNLHEHLVSKLYSVSHSELDFYITYIVYITLTSGSTALASFLAELASQNLSFYLKMLWSLQAYSSCCKYQQTKGWKERVENLERTIEMGMVNSAVTREVLEKAQKEQSSPEETALIMQKFKDKEYRSNYNNTQNKFISYLIKISIYLKQYQEGERRQRLREYIEKLNNFIQYHRGLQKWVDDVCSNILQIKNIRGIIYFYGMMVPFKKVRGHRYLSNLIVNIVNDDFLCFNTKKRAPYKIVFETVDMEEMREHMGYFDNLARGQQTCESSEDDLPELANVQAESASQIDKEMYSGLAKWAQIKKKEEISKQNRGIIKRLLSLQKLHASSSDNIESYTIQKLDMLVRQATVSGANTQTRSHHLIVLPDKQGQIPNNIKPPHTMNSAEAQAFKQKFAMNLKQFTEKFPQTSILNSNNNHRRRHSHPSMNPKQVSQYDCKEDQNNHNSPLIGRSRESKDCYSSKDLKIKDVIEFFKELLSTNVNNYSKIKEIYKYLHYDVIETTMYQATPNQNLKEVEFPRVFGPWGEIWSDKAQVIKETSPFRILQSYTLRPFIIKGGDDLRQELLAMNIIEKFHEIFLFSNTPIFLKPYEIIVESDNSGFIEFLPNTLSIDALKKKSAGFKNLNEFYLITFGEFYLEAQKNFIESLAGYSLACYLLQIKDRHNGNILIDNQGHIIHIDFGFILTTAPGGIKFETAHFKITSEYVELMGGRNSDQFGYFKSLLIRGFIELKKHVSSICNLVSIMHNQSTLPCFAEFDMPTFRARFKESYTDKEFVEYVEDLIKGSCDKWSTYQYDKFQQMTNGILP